MTLFLRQSTEIKVRMGPFMDATDAVTPEVGITLAGADQAEVLKANGVATVTMSGTFAAITGADGWYDYTAVTTDVDVVGEVVFVVQDTSVSLPVFVRGYVVEETVYDAMYASSAKGPLQPTVVGRTLDVTATGEGGLDFSNTLGTLDAAQFGADFITAAKIANDAFLAVNFAAGSLDGKGDWNLGKTGYDITQGAADKVFGSSGAAIAELAATTLPAVTPRPDQLLMLLYMALRNKLDITSTTKEIHNAAEAQVATKALTDDGSTYSEAEMIAGT